MAGRYAQHAHQAAGHVLKQPSPTTSIAVHPLSCTQVSIQSLMTHG
jgi:hypothetical protein